MCVGARPCPTVPDGVRPGTTFTWRSDPGRITSTFAAVDPEREPSWTGPLRPGAARSAHRGVHRRPLLLAADIAVFYGVIDRTAPINALAALPIALWECSLGVYLTFKGFRSSSPLLTPPNADVGIPSPIPSLGAAMS